MRRVPYLDTMIQGEKSCSTNKYRIAPKEIHTCFFPLPDGDKSSRSWKDWQRDVTILRDEFFFIDRFELSSHHISYWKLFVQISYRKDTLLRGVPNSCWTSRGSNSHHLKAVQQETAHVTNCAIGPALWYLIFQTNVFCFMWSW